jgi:hypothetical protein
MTPGVLEDEAASFQQRVLAMMHDHRLPALAGALLLALAYGAVGAAAQQARDDYASYDALTREVRALAGNRLALLTSIGKSDAGRDIWLLTVGNERTGPLDQKPALLIVANLEGNHLIGSMAALHTARHLVSEYGANPDVTRLLDTRTLYIVPRLNPDGAELVWSHPAYELPYKPHRSNPAAGGLSHREIGRDLNGDGLVTVMRVRDPEGEYMIDPDDPRLMRMADRAKQERGGYALYVEGIDPAEMERYLASGSDGVNLNRNFPHDYLYYQPHVGRHQVSEAETRALVDFAFTRTNIAAVLTFSAYDNLRSAHPPNAPRPPGVFAGPPNLPTNLLRDDRPYFEFVSERFREMTGLSGGGAEGEAGSWPQFAYYQMGLPSFTTPVWAVPGTGQTGAGQTGAVGQAAGGPMPAEPRGEMVEGSWAISLSVGGQAMAASLLVRRVNGDLAVTLESPGGAAELTGQGAGGSFTAAGEIPQLGAVTVTGAVAGDRMTGSVGLGPMGSADFTGERTGGGATPGAAPAPARGRPVAGNTPDHRWLTFFDENGIDGFVEWTAATHPTLGAVEVGGFVPNSRVNPPPGQAAALLGPHAEFAVWLGLQTPLVRVVDTTVERRGDGVFLVKATLENDGYFPTRLEMGQRTAMNHPVSVRLLPRAGVTILTGNPQDQLSRIDGMGSRSTVTWLVQGDPGTRLTLEVYGERSGGLQSATVTLR